MSIGWVPLIAGMKAKAMVGFGFMEAHEAFSALGWLRIVPKCFFTEATRLHNILLLLFLNHHTDFVIDFRYVKTFLLGCSNKSFFENSFNKP